MTGGARGALAAAALLAASCGSSASTSTPGTSAAAPASAAAATATASASAAGAVAASVTAAATAAAVAPGAARATAPDCEKLHEASRTFGRAMLEEMERDAARREALFAEMEKKLAENKKDYLAKCVKLSAAGVSCAADALSRRDTVALAACPIDISVLDRE